MANERDILRFLDNQIQNTEENLNDLYEMRDNLMGSFGGGGNIGGSGRRVITRGTGRGYSRGDSNFDSYSGGGSYRGFRGGSYRGRNYGDESDFDMDAIGDRLSRIEGFLRDLPNLGPTSRDRIPGERAFSSTRDAGPTVEVPGIGDVPVDKAGTIDRRTEGGRLATDARGLNTDDLANMLDDVINNPQLHNQDGTIDLRTKEGRALVAAGWLDDNGNITDEAKQYVDIEGDAGEDEHGTKGASSNKQEMEEEIPVQHRTIRRGRKS